MQTAVERCKKTFYVSELFLGVFLTVAIFSMGMLYSTQPPENPQIEKYGAAQTDHEAAKIAADERIARYTWWLAVLTGALVGVSLMQGFFLLRADKTARIAADAANLSARAAVGQKLPIIRCKTPHMWPVKDPFDDGAHGFLGSGDPTKDNFIKVIELDFFNHGETLAYPREYGLGWLLTEKDPVKIEVFPPDPDYPDIYRLSNELVIGSKFTTPRIVTFCLALDDELKKKIRDSAVTLRLCARLKYFDFLGDPHEARFCWRWLHGSRDGRLRAGLYPDDDVPETYTRKT